ncbi:hypothetical protein [Kitasatospora sp. NPDC056531]|uniref:hypothetical protein n=1 Tax=Kitasatospora sp. NPDC056531 TaxID=3345856 RepID=UPI0036988EAE
MNSTYLLPIRTAALLFPALALLMFVPTAIVLYRWHGVMTRCHGAGWIALSVVPSPHSDTGKVEALQDIYRRLGDA